MKKSQHQKKNIIFIDITLIKFIKVTKVDVSKKLINFSIAERKAQN